MTSNSVNIASHVPSNNINIASHTAKEKTVEEIRMAAVLSENRRFVPFFHKSISNFLYMNSGHCYLSNDYQKFTNICSEKKIDNFR